MHMTRRNIMAATGAVAAASILGSPHIASAAAPFELPTLPFGEDALAPHISAKTVALHYGKHHKGYFDKLDPLVKGTPYADMDLEEIVVAAAQNKDAKVFNNAAQAWNHVAYWQQFTLGGPTRPDGKLADELAASFGDYDAFVAKVVATSDEVFGTGWVWLTRDNADTLALVGYEDGNNPLAVGRPAYLGIDIWEHAYYVDYENRKPEHIKAVLANLVNWRIIADRVDAG
jgi:Fe-Mn family superoxide dismutase